MFDARGRGFPHANPQAPEVIAQLCDEIANAVVARRATTLLQLHDARWEIQLIVRDENLFDRNLVEGRDTARRAATAVHVSHWLEEPDLVPIDTHARELPLVLRLVA